MDDLVERVARLVAESCERLNVPPRDIARSIIPIVYEDAVLASRVRVDWGSETHPEFVGGFETGVEEAAKSIRSRSMAIVGES